MYPPAITKQSEIEAAITYVETSLIPEVVHIRYEIGKDWGGEWAIFFRIVITDDAAKRRLRDVTKKVELALDRRLDYPSLGVYVYHNYRSASEQAQLQEPAWA